MIPTAGQTGDDDADAARAEGSAPSKTRRKKDMHALQALGERLVELPSGELAALDLPERLAAAIAEAKRISGFEARRRQMQYIGRLMRDVDAQPIAARLAALDLGARRENARHHAVEAWRDRLLADDSAATELVQAFPHADLQQLRTLVRNARKERSQARPPHAARALFRALRALIEASPQ